MVVKSITFCVFEDYGLEGISYYLMYNFSFITETGTGRCGYFC